MPRYIREIETALEDLDREAPAGRLEYLKRAALKTPGGYFHAPEPGNTWDGQVYEIKAIHVFAQGADAEETVRNWQHAAKRECTIAAANKK